MTSKMFRRSSTSRAPWISGGTRRLFAGGHVRRALVSALVASAAWHGLPAPAWAQAADAPYPTRPVNLLVGFAPGGSADILARLMAQKLSASLGQQLVVENKPGAGATIAAGAVAGAAADGHTLLFVTSGHAGSSAMFARLPYNPVTAFAPVALVASTPVVIVVPSSSNHRTLADLLTAARAAPGKLNYAAGGGGATTTNLAAEFLKSAAGLNMQAIAYKGSGPALIALLAGEVDLGFDIPSSSLPHIRAGKLRALAVTSRARVASMADVPTVAEGAVPGFDVIGWFGVMAPAATPAGVIARLNREINAALAQADVKERMASLALESGGGTPAAFASLIEADTRRYGDAIRKLGIKPE